MSDPIYETVAQPFQDMHTKHGASSSSARLDEQSSALVAQASQVKDKVKCTRYGCSAFVNKDSLARHLKEVHEKKIKVICAGCGRGFKRQYQMNEHRCGGS